MRRVSFLETWRIQTRDLKSLITLFAARSDNTAQLERDRRQLSLSLPFPLPLPLQLCSFSFFLFNFRRFFRVALNLICLFDCSRHYFVAAPTLASKGGCQSVHSTCQESLQVSIPLDQLVAPPRRRPTDLISSSNSRLKADLKTKTEFLRRYEILLLVANNFDSRRLTEFQSGFGCRG